MGYFEEYKCGCVSEVEKRRKDLAGYCATHGGDCVRVFREGKKVAVMADRVEAMKSEWEKEFGRKVIYAEPSDSHEGMNK